MKRFGVLLAAGLAALLGAAELDVNIHPLGGNVRGFGVLAEYPAGGPKRLKLVRTTRPGGDKAGPDYYWGWPNLCSLRIFDPAGKLVKFVDLGKQSEAVKSYEVELPAGPAGVWRFSVANGSNDRYRIEFPDTPVWGVRGEMALGVGKQFPKELYLYVPESSELLICESFGNAAPEFEADGRPLEGELKKLGRSWKRLVPDIPRGGTVRVKLGRMSGKAFAIDGMPGLLCPTPEAAAKLKGGLVEEAGVLVAGPLQARARRLVAGFKPEDFELNLDFLDKVPAELENPQLEAVLYGKYGASGMLIPASRLQITDPAGRWCGALIAPEKRGELSERNNFLANRQRAYFDAAALAGLATIPAKLNAAYRSRAVVNRAVIAAFHNFIHMQGDDLLREGDFRNTNYPVTHAFFAYAALAQALADLRDLLTPEQREIWSEALTAAGDKLVAYMAYESNQWAHMMYGHLNTYAATGEERFRGYFETLMNAYLDNTFGPASKHGQHPAGYFLEEYGPDGNYDQLNSFCVVASYYKYRNLPGADPVLVEKLRRGIEKDLQFKSCYWLVQPDGGICSPNALNCRTDGNLASPSWPGDYIAGMEFDLGYTRFLMNRMPESGPGQAATFGHIVNSDEWARRLLEREVPAKGNYWKDRGTFGSIWISDVYNAYQMPRKAKPVQPPCLREQFFKMFPGQIAWKEGNLYGLVFYDVEGANPKQELVGITSGGPLALWTPEAGTALAGVRNGRKNKVETPDDVTWSTVTGTLPGGRFFAGGKERNAVREIEPGRAYELTGTLRNDAGKIAWNYRWSAGKLTLTVKLTEPKLTAPALNLPFVDHKGETEMALAAPGIFRYRRGTGTVTLAYPASLQAELSGVLKTGGAPVRMLRIPFPTDGVLELVFQAGRK